MVKHCKNGCNRERYKSHAHCVKCENARIKAWREHTGDKTSKRYYKRNSKTIKKKALERYHANPIPTIAKVAAHRKANPDKTRDAAYKRNYGLTLTQYNKMLEVQGGVCAICQQAPKGMRLAVDHEHIRKKDVVTPESGRVRGAACFRCNKFVIGRWRAEHGVLLRRAADYLESKFDGRKL